MRELPTLNATETGFVLEGRPCFGRTFLAATSFHAPEGLAAVRDETGAYHLDLNGEPQYSARFLDAFGFYEGLAAVRDERGWFHLRTDGSALHERRFRWSGNFQGGRCAVQDQHGFLHLDTLGVDAYPQRHRYVGDFRHGIAVAHGAKGAFHLLENGSPLNRATYAHAEPFHKGYAVVSDAQGFFHVDKHGVPLHPLRLESAEPFYNGVALCRERGGGMLRLRVNGTWTRVAAILEPVTLADLQRQLYEGARVGLFLRHAERPSIAPDDPNWGNDVRLTERGKDDAACLGRALASASSIGLWSSPIERCQETCQAVARGAGIGVDGLRTHTHLGHPGIHFDRTHAHVEPMRRDFHAFATGYLDNGTALGMRPVPEVSEELLAWLAEQMARAACTVFVTHDLFAAALMSYLGLKAPDREDWCDYLEGVCLIDAGDGVSYRRFVGLAEVRR